MKKQLIKCGNNHVFISGITRSGKTYFAREAAARLPYGVLFINIQSEQLNSPYIRVTESDDTNIIIENLKKGRKINFDCMNLTEKDIYLIIYFLLNKLMRAGFNQNKPVYVVLDEAQILKEKALDAAITVSTRGLAKGVRLISITQRPALVNKTIYTQAAEQYIFYLALSEKTYLKNKGLDYDACAELWQQYGKHSYIYSDGYVLEGHKKID